MSKKTITPILEGHVESFNEQFKIVLTYAGEGYEGDYNENDESDEPLLRADLYERIDEEPGNDFCDEESESTCTLYSARRTKDEAAFLAGRILSRMTDYKKNNPGAGIDDIFIMECNR